MDTNPEARSIVCGIGISRIGRRTGIPGLELTLEAARQAIADAGLQPSDVDGIATMGDTPPGEVAAAFGIEPLDHTGGYPAGGLLDPVMSAMRAVGDRRARHVLVYRTVQMVGGSILPQSDGGQPEDLPPSTELRRAQAPPTEGSLLDVMGDLSPLLAAHAYSAANWLAMHCQRHMHLYGTSREQLGWLAVSSRRNAALNPLAVYRDPITLADHLGARVVSSPFGLLDCDVPVDGSIAVVVSHEDHLAGCDHGVRVAAIGGNHTSVGWYERPDFPKMASVDAAADMWSRTDLTPGDVDIAELYDGFSFLTFAWLEALGLVEEGGSGPFVEGGTRIALDGELPLNTYGGQLSAGRMHGYWVLHEACVQLRGQGGDRQVPGAPEVAVVAAGGGPIAGCMLLTR